LKFSVDWLGDFVDVAAVGGVPGIRKRLDQAGVPVESVAEAGRDTRLEAEITPNRPDAMGHRGLAREIAAMAGVPMKDVSGRYAEPPTGGEATEHLTSIVIQVPRLCRRFGARLVRGTENRPATELVRRRLASIDAKSISAAVDATNYVLWDTSQPLHAFDFDKLAGGLLFVRKAQRGETLVTLDGIERALDPSDIVVADAERAVSLAGIMGGLETAVTEGTRNILLEAAWWDPASIRRTARRLGIHTDASHRFERGADIDAIPGALSLAARLLMEAAGGTVAPGLLDAHGNLFRVRRTSLRLSRLRLVSGDNRLTLEFAEEALSRLGFSTERRGKHVTVSIPLYRTDVRREDDLVEEVLRVYGYDRLPSRLPAARAPGEIREPLRRVEDLLSDAAVAEGLLETINLPFVDRDHDEVSYGDWLRLTETELEPLSIVNPLDASRRHLRATLLPGLLDAVSRNVRRGVSDVALFETGRTFGRRGEPEKPESFESRRFAFAFAGERRPHWSVPEPLRRADFFDAKGVFEKLLERWIDPHEMIWRPAAVPAFMPSSSAVVVTASGRLLGIVGLASEPERQKRDLPPGVFAGEILVEAIPSERRPFRFRDFSSRPSITADLSLVHSRDLPWGRIEEFVRRQPLQDLESLRCLDRYEGPEVPAGGVKTTIRLTFRSAERSLEQEEVNRVVQRLAEALRSELNVSISGWGRE